MTFSASGQITNIERQGDLRVATVQFPSMGGALQGEASLTVAIHPDAKVSRGDFVNISGSINHSVENEHLADSALEESPSAEEPDVDDSDDDLDDEDDD